MAHPTTTMSKLNKHAVAYLRGELNIIDVDDLAIAILSDIEANADVYLHGPLAYEKYDRLKTLVEAAIADDWDNPEVRNRHID